MPMRCVQYRKTMKDLIPKALIYFRLVIGVVLLVLGITGPTDQRPLIVLLMSVGLLTDIFDGIIARRLGVSTRQLRRLDSSVDQFFFLAASAVAFFLCPAFFEFHSARLIILLASEGLAYLICLIRFRKEIATHSIGSKIWALLLFATLTQIILQCQSGVLFELCFWTGILTRLEIAAILLTLRTWTSDVPSFYHAIQLRKGREIKRNKLFNG